MGAGSASAPGLAPDDLYAELCGAFMLSAGTRFPKLNHKDTAAVSGAAHRKAECGGAFAFAASGIDMHHALFRISHLRLYLSRARSFVRR